MFSMTVFLPALLMVFGRYWFFPFVPRHDDVVTYDRGVWGRVARLIGRRARVVWITVALVLTGAALFTTQLDASGLTTAEQFTTDVDSVQGQEVLARHYPAGSGVPVECHRRGKGCRPASIDVARGSWTGVADARAVSRRGRTPPTPKVVDGKVQVQAVLTDPADSPAAEDTVLRLRSAVDEIGEDVLVGGGTAVVYDIKQESARDTRVIIPAVLVVILLVLALLLRAVVAPLLLVATVVLSFFATLGICSLVFDHVFGFAGADPSFPLVRVRVPGGTRHRLQHLPDDPGARGDTIHGTRQGTLKALAVTGGVITSAGIVLAATFSALGVLPLVPFAELGFAVAFGVLLDTLIVRSLLVPALVYELDDKVWWPNSMRRTPAGEPTPPRQRSSAEPEGAAIRREG